MIFDDELAGFIKNKQKRARFLLSDIKGFNYRNEFYKIKKYLNEFLKDERKESRFIVMPGLRGVGKTTILLQLYDYLLNEKMVDNKNLLYLSMDEIVTNFDTNLLNVVDNFLYSVHKTDKLALDKKIFIFVDESHFDKKWAISGKIIYDNTKNIFLICTGSSAIDLEISGDVARRSFNESIYPSNFKDYLLLKHNIHTKNEFSKTLENIIYFGEEKFVNKGIDLEENVQNQIFALKQHPMAEFYEFLKKYGFPFALNLADEKAYEQTYALIKKVIENDIPSIKSLNTDTTVNIWRIVIYIALARSELISNHKIANYLSISSKLVNDILNILEKSQLIFNVKPFGGSGKIVRKPWKYYFLSPTLKAAANVEFGRFNLDNKKCLGLLAENYVATSLFKMNQTRFQLMGLFYPPEKKGTDFLLRTKLDDMVPIEVGIGKKTKSQLTRAINKYGSDYGVLISNRYHSIQQHNDIIHIPLLSFGFL